MWCMYRIRFLMRKYFWYDNLNLLLSNSTKYMYCSKLKHMINACILHTSHDCTLFLNMQQLASNQSINYLGLNMYNDNDLFWPQKYGPRWDGVRSHCNSLTVGPSHSCLSYCFSSHRNCSQKCSLLHSENNMQSQRQCIWIKSVYWKIQSTHTYP